MKKTLECTLLLSVLLAFAASASSCGTDDAGNPSPSPPTTPSPAPSPAASIDIALTSREVETLKTEVATLKTENTTLKADIEGLKKGFDRLVKRLAKKDQLAEQIAAKTDRIEITEGEIAKAEREKAEVERLLKDPRNSPDAKRHFEGQRRAVTNKLEELRAEKATLVKEREKLEADLTALGKAAK